MMDRVLISLIPILLLSLFLYGLRTLVLLAVVCLAGLLTEYAAMRLINGSKAKITEAALVSCFLYTLTLPPATPYWVAIIGIAFGLFFGKGVFGGFGKNVFNPALVGRCFVYISFPTYLTIRWTEPFTSFPGGLIRYDHGLDAITKATPIVAAQSNGAAQDYLPLLSGFTAGSLGETSAILILAAAVYLLVTRTASWVIMLSTATGFLGVSTVLYVTGVIEADPIVSILTGGILFAVVFMATDPVSAPNQLVSKIIYGALIGILSVTIRHFSLFTEGVMFAVLIANVFVPLIDRHVKAFTARKKVTA